LSDDGSDDTSCVYSEVSFDGIGFRYKLPEPPLTPLIRPPVPPVPLVPPVPPPIKTAPLLAVNGDSESGGLINSTTNVVSQMLSSKPQQTDDTDDSDNDEVWE
jgi:hypothetical protein